MTRRAHDIPQASGSERGLASFWRSLNTPKPVDAAGMRVACSTFLVAYAVIAIVRYEESHQAFFGLRVLVCLYAAFGIWLARRVTWRSARAYTNGLAFLLPMQSAYIDGMLGNHVAEIALSALATFVPLVFLQAGWDLVVASIGLAVGHTVILNIVPSPAVPLPAVGVMLGGAIASGTCAGLLTQIYRARWSESVEQIERALSVSAEWKNRYEAASLASGQILYERDCRSDDVSYGGAHERILGYTLEDLAGGLARWMELVHPEDRDAFDRELRRTAEDKVPFGMRYRARRKDGSYVFVEDSGHFVMYDDGGIGHLVGFVSDVTERTMTERFREEEAATSGALARVGRELISSLETPVLLERLCRLTTEVLDCDFSSTWLWKRDEKVYQPIASYGMPLDEWEAIRVLRIRSNPETPLFARLAREEIAQVTPASSQHPVTAGMLAYYGVSIVLCVGLRRGNEVVGIHAAGYRTRTEAFTDVQERIARGIAQLASMALSNAQLVEELERASRLKSEFVSTMSHELRTPLNVIIGYTDMLTDELSGDRNSALISRIRESSVELLEMIDATLNLNRLAAGKDLPQLEAVCVADLWEELRTEFAALPRSTRVILRWETGGVEYVKSDRRKLKMIVKNLVGNALKFTSTGEVVVRSEPSSSGVAITITDTGIGIPVQHLPHIFDMFRQVDSSDRRSYGGAGLGLYIVRQLVDQLGATITVESEPGRGSTFRVLLRLDAAAAAAGVAA